MSQPLVPPLCQSSVYTLPDLDALERIYSGTDTGFIYARDGHPNAAQLAETISTLHHAQWSQVCGSGMAALSAAMIPLLRQGDRIVASNRLYGRTTQLLRNELARFGVTTSIVNANDLEAVRRCFEIPARLMLVETMSNPLCRVVDIAALAAICKSHECLLIVDNTFATPHLCRPLDSGAALVMESLTKMMGGHGDVTLGSVSGRDPDLFPAVAQAASIWGFAANPFDAWLAQRGLETLALRMDVASANAAALAEWLPTQPGVSRVVYPGRSDHPDVALVAPVLGGNAGNMLCFELDRGRDAVNEFMRRAVGIAFSPSLGSTHTTCSYPWLTSHRYDSPAEKQRQGISDGLIRLSVGIEDLTVIQREMARGLVR